MTKTTEQRTRTRRTMLAGVSALGATIALTVVGVSGGSAASEPNDGRAPGASPGAAVDAASPVASDDGRSARDVAARGSATARSSASSASVPLDNGRGGPDPAFGPNPVAGDAARSAAPVERGVDTDSGAVPAPDAGASTPPSGAPDDADAPLAPQAGGTTVSNGPAESPVDQDR